MASTPGRRSVARRRRLTPPATRRPGSRPRVAPACTRSSRGTSPGSAFTTPKRLRADAPSLAAGDTRSRRAPPYTLTRKLPLGLSSSSWGVSRLQLVSAPDGREAHALDDHVHRWPRDRRRGSASRRLGDLAGLVMPLVLSRLPLALGAAEGLLGVVPRRRLPRARELCT
jgi:hypothetical protein